MLLCFTSILLQIFLAFIWFPQAQGQTNPFQLNHVGISVANMTLQRAWYNHTLGFSELIQYIPPTRIAPTENTTIESAQLLNPVVQTVVELIHLSSSIPSDRNNSTSVTAAEVQGLFHWAYKVPNLNQTIAVLEEANVTVIQPIALGATYKDGTPTRFAYICDAEGNLIEFFESSFGEENS